MNPSSNETPGMQLPSPAVEYSAAGNTIPLPGQGGPEQLPVAPAEMQPAAAAQPPAAMPQIALPAVPATIPTPQTDVSTTSTPSTTSKLADSDLIEKEWVTRAKAIVERTREDPHQQAEQLTGVKAEYLKTQYNKTLKMNK